ncbi:NADH-quinone oxidoreductase subunit N [Buchnera aphidicola (Taiwanaphis decaspermi)]|uniref:NADH-quinone oxidoreductase subunit N n=1 Tax=Buchnera aphidicola TaxID=9 RepID=UPI0031B80DAF
MTKFIFEYIYWLPFIFLIVTIITNMLTIIFLRKHNIIYYITLIGLKLSFLSLFFLIKIIPVNMTILLKINMYNIFYSGITILSSIFIVYLSYDWLKKLDINKEEFYLLVLTSTLGSFVLINANHMLSLFLGIELISLPSFGLIGYLVKDKKSMVSSLKYTILSSISSIFILFGISLIYSYMGTLSFEELYQQLILINNCKILLLGWMLFFIGFAFKLSIFPFHLWISDIYDNSSIISIIILSTISKIPFFSVLIKMFLNTSYYIYDYMYYIFIFTSLLSILSGNLMALFQNNIKKIIAYTSISNIGYVLTVFLCKNKLNLSLECLSIYFLSYLLSIISICGLLLIIDLYQFKNKKNKKQNFFVLSRGLFWKHPFFAIMITFIILSLASFPLTFNFIGKIYIYILLVKSKLWFLIFPIIISNIMLIYFCLNIIINLYSHNNSFKKILKKNYLCNKLGIITILSTFFSITLGLYPQLIIDIIQYINCKIF